MTGSAHEFPYTKKSYHIEGLAYPIVKDPDELDRREEILKTRIQNAERIKREVDAWISLSFRIRGEKWRLRWGDEQQRTV